MLTYLYSKYQSGFEFFNIRYIIKNKVNSPILVINFSPKAFGCLRLIFLPICNKFFFSILRTFTIYFKKKPAL